MQERRRLPKSKPEKLGNMVPLLFCQPKRSFTLIEALCKTGAFVIKMLFK